MREQFEKLPEIAELLIEAQFDEQTGEYVSYWSHNSGYLNGAWYTFQEQQKKIDQLVGVINAGLKIEQSMSDQIHSLKEKINATIEYLDSTDGLVWYAQIKDILK